MGEDGEDGEDVSSPANFEGDGHGDAWEPLRSITSFFGGREIEFEVQLILRRGEVPPCSLFAEEEDAPRLGWFTWIKSGAAFARDPGDTVLLLN